LFGWLGSWLVAAANVETLGGFGIGIGLPRRLAGMDVVLQQMLHTAFGKSANRNLTSTWAGLLALD